MGSWTCAAGSPVEWFERRGPAFVVKQQGLAESLTGRLLYLAHGTLQVDFTITEGGAAQRSTTLLFQDEILDLSLLRIMPRSTLRAIGADALYYLATEEHVAGVQNANDLLERAGAITGRLARQKTVSATCTIEGQLCTLLVELGARFGVRSGREVHFDLPLSRDVMAAVIGVRPESLSRAFSHAKASGLIQLTGRSHVAVPDWEALCAKSPIAELVIAANR